MGRPRSNKTDGYVVHRNSGTYAITIPPDTGALVPEDARFDCELTDDGILFRRRVAPPAPPELPDWVQGGGARA